MIQKSSNLNLVNTRAEIYSMTTFIILLFVCIIQPTTSLDITSTYPGNLTLMNGAFVRPDGDASQSYFYQALQFNASVSGQYTFSASSVIKLITFGALYAPSFDPTNPTTNLIKYDSGWGDHQFSFANALEIGQTYILVISTYMSMDIGDYTAIINGPASIVMTPILPVVISKFDGTLSNKTSNYFHQDDDTSSKYYYQAMHVNISQRGYYTFRSESEFWSDGSLYNGTFDPNFRGINLVASGHYIGSSSQFFIGYPLETNVTYILVYSTYYAGIIGDFRVVSIGPESLTLIPYKLPIPIDMSEFYFGIGYSGFVGLILVLSVITCKRK